MTLLVVLIFYILALKNSMTVGFFIISSRRWFWLLNSWAWNGSLLQIIKINNCCRWTRESFHNKDRSKVGLWAPIFGQKSPPTADENMCGGGTYFQKCRHNHQHHHHFWQIFTCVQSTDFLTTNISLWLILSFSDKTK